MYVQIITAESARYTRGGEKPSFQKESFTKETMYYFIYTIKKELEV